MSPALPRSSAFHVTIETVCRGFAPSSFFAKPPFFAPPSFFAESTFLAPSRASA